jgi:hypothetical protein
VYLWPQKFNMYITGGVVLTAVLRMRIRIWIRIHRIHVFLGLLDPDRDPLVRGMDPDPDPDLDPSNIKRWWLIFYFHFRYYWIQNIASYFIYIHTRGIYDNIF